MYKLQRHSSRGFTIIEVLIVVAIAGLIIALALYAAPALQRNSRNTAIKNDANIVGSTISEFMTNNDGKAPTGVSGANGALTISGAASTSPATAKIQGSTTVSTATAAPAADAPAIGSIQVRLGAKCSGTASTRSFAIYYSIETSGDTAQKCTDV